MDISFAKTLKKLTSRKPLAKGRSQLTHPYRDWKLLLALFFVLFVVLVSWNIYVFWQIRIGELLVTTNTPSVQNQTLDKDLLQRVLNFGAQKEQTYNILIDNPPSLRSPAP